MLRLAASTTITRFLTAVFNFGTVVLLSRYLGAAGRGVCATYGVVVAVALVFSDLAGGATVPYLMHRLSWLKMHRFYRVSSLFFSGLVALSFTLISRLAWSTGCWLWLICWLNAMAAFQQHIFLGLKRIMLFNALSILPALLLFSALGAGFNFGFSGTDFYLWSFTLAWLVTWLLGLWQLNHQPQPHDFPENSWKQTGRMMFSSGSGNQLVHVAAMVNNRMIFYLLPPAVLGVFSNGLALAEAMLIVPGSMGQVYYAQHAGKKHPEQSRTYFGKLLVLSFSLLLAGWGISMMIPEHWFIWLFGNGFAGVKTFLGMLALGEVCYGLYLLNSYRNSSRGRFTRNLNAVLAGLMVQLAGIFIFYHTARFDIQHLSMLLSASLAITGIYSLMDFLKPEPASVGSRE